MDKQDEIIERFTRHEITAEELVTQLADLNRRRCGCTCHRATELPESAALQRARLTLERLKRYYG